jgi:hypothetical protein
VENIFRVIFLIFCVEHGIIHKRRPPYSPQSNGVAEIKNRTLTDLVNSMLRLQEYLRNSGVRRS